jgi:hypothetical protein
MKFDAARMTGMIDELADPEYEGQEGEANVADFVAQQFTQMGMAVERRKVMGSGFPQRVALWVGWLVYGILMTATYLTLLPKNYLIVVLAIPLFCAGTWWLDAVLLNTIHLGRQRPPLESAPLVIASFPSGSPPPIRVVFQAVLGGLNTDFFQAFRLDRHLILLVLHLGVMLFILMTFVAQKGGRSGGSLLLAIDSVFLAAIWIGIACVLSWEYRRSRSVNESQTDRRGLSVLMELARCWPRTRSNQVEAVFVAAGGQRLDYAGSREVVRLCQSEWPRKPSFLVLFFAPGPGKELLVYEQVADPSAMKRLVDEVSTSLWIPVQRTDLWTIAPLWPIASAWAAQAIAIIGSDLSATSEAQVDPQVLHRAIQLSCEIALRWAKNQQKPVDS